MKKPFLLCITLLALHCQAQISKIDGVNTFKVKNAGAIMDKNKDVDGYYFYYVLDKLKKGNAEFAIQILDKNLVEVAKKSYIDDKHTVLMNSKFNNQAMMFAMGNWDDKQITLLTYDKQANLTQTTKIPLESKEARYYAMFEKSGQLSTLFPVDNKGFLFNKLEDNKKIGYSLKYYPTDGGQAWEFNSPNDSKEILGISPIEVNDKVVVAIESAKPGMMSGKLTLRTKVIDINTGKLLYEREYSKKGKPRIINNAFLDSDSNVVLMGEYFDEGDNIMKDKSLGMFTEVVDMSGKTIKESFISWKDDVSKIVKTQNGFLEDKGYVYFHNIVRTASNDYYAIGEFYKKTVSAMGVASAILNRGNSTSSLSQLTITNSVVFKFNSDFKLVNIQIHQCHQRARTFAALHGFNNSIVK